VPREFTDHLVRQFLTQISQSPPHGS